MKTVKTKIVAMAVATAILLAAALTTVLVLVNSDGLQSMRNKSFTRSYTYGGIEIVEEDGLFYLTKDGKKLSKTGYASIIDPNSYYDTVSHNDLLNAPDFKIYTYYLARKTDADTYFLIDTEGKELAIEGADLVFEETKLPFLKFKSTLTGKYALLSLNEFDCALSSNAGEELSLRMYDEFAFIRTNIFSVQQDMVEAKSTNSGASAATSYAYMDGAGKTLFTSPATAADKKAVELSAVNTAYYFLTGDKKLYRADGTLIASDVTALEADDQTASGSTRSRWLAAYCTPNDEKLNATENAQKAFYKIISASSEHEIKASEYVISAPSACINGSLLYANSVETGKLTVFSLLDGTKCADYSSVLDTAVPSGLFVVTKQTDSQTLYDYFDLDTGKMLLSSKYSDMEWMANAAGVLVSASEKSDRDAKLTASEPPSAYAHFVNPYYAEKAVTIAANQTVSNIVRNEFFCAYKLATVKYQPLDAAEPTVTYTEASEYIYLPFADAQTASYDTIQVLDVFNGGAGVAIATDYIGGKLDFIDMANAKVVYTVNAAGADMAKTTVNHINTLALVSDVRNDQSVVDFAVFSIQKKNDNGELVSTEYITLNRASSYTLDAMFGSEYITSPITVKSDFGKDLYADRQYNDGIDGKTSPFMAATYEQVQYTTGVYTVASHSSYLTVTTSKWSTDVYVLKSNLTLEKLSTIPYEVVGQKQYGESLDEIHFTVKNDTGSYGLYTPDGQQILAPVYSNIDSFGEYIMAQRQNAYAMFKYNADKQKTKQLLDFEFVNYQHLTDGYFLLMDNTRQIFLYEGGELVKKDAVTGMFVGYNYVIHSETERLQYNGYMTVNIDGNSYIYRGEARNVGFSEFWSGNYRTLTVNNADVKVVNFREADGTLIESKVIYGASANHKSFVEFALPADSNWYISGVKAQQTQNVTKDDIAASTSSVINLYKAPAASII